MALNEAVNSLMMQPRYALMRMVARFELVRKGVAGLRAFRRAGETRRLLEDCRRRMDQSCFQGVDIKTFVEKLREDGAAFGLVLPDRIIHDLNAYALSEPCYAFRDTRYGFKLTERQEAEKRLEKPILIAQYFNTIDNCREVARLAIDPLLLRVAAEYLGSVPKFVGANLWWTFPVAASEEDRSRYAHFFHRDVDDFRFFKFFFYLTPVQAGDGGHVCVLGSHKMGNMPTGLNAKRLRRFSDDEVETAYDSSCIKEIVGDAGVGFAEDTFCLHKGKTPSKTPRLLLQLQYALFDYNIMHDRRPMQDLHRLV